MEAKILLLLASIVVASGCSSVNPFKSSEEPDIKSTPVSGKGLEVTNLEVVDPTLRPGQSTVLSLTLKNYHISDTSIESMKIYNTGILEAEDDWRQSCTPTEIQEAQQGINPEMQCEFRVTAPDSAELEGFRSKQVNPRIQITYDTGLTNSGDVYNVEFRPQNEIREAGTVKKSYSNGEVKLKVSGDQPVPSETGGSLFLELNPAGNGRVVTQDDGTLYKVNTESGADAFNGGKCEGEQVIGEDAEIAPGIDNSASFRCELNPSGAETLTQPVVFSISYKYRISPAFNIEVINDNGA